METLKNDIEKLNKIISIYETTENLNGSFYTDFLIEIKSQIDFLNNCINNLNSLNK